MQRRRPHAELEPHPEKLRRERLAAKVPGPVDSRGSTDSPQARLIALQRSAGNAAAERFLRGGPCAAVLARQTAQDAAAPAAPAPAAPVGAPSSDIAAAARAVVEQRLLEDRLLANTVVPEILATVVPIPRLAATESLPEVTLRARDSLIRYLRQQMPAGVVPLSLLNSVADIQKVVLKQALDRKITIPGHREATDQAGLEREAKALADLAVGDAKLPGAAVQAGAGGFKFTFDGQIAASGRVGGADVSVKGGAGGVQGTVKSGDTSVTASGTPSGAKVEGKGGPVTAAGEVAKDSAKLKLTIAAGPVAFNGSIAGKVGEPTKWSVDIEVKFGGGADPVPDPAAVAAMIHDARRDVVEAARAVGDALAGSIPHSQIQSMVETKVLPAKGSIEKVAGYMQAHKAKPATQQPRATIGISAQGEGGGFSAMLSVNISF